MPTSSKLAASYIVLGLLILVSGSACIFFVIMHNLLQLVATGGIFLLSLLALLVLVFCFTADPEYAYVRVSHPPSMIAV